MNILDKIVAQKQLEVAASKKLFSTEELKEHAFFTQDFFTKRKYKNKSGIIAEFKRKSPSKGIINDIENPLSVVCSYEKYGASGISILTDTEFFGGSKEDILNVREHINIPILRKDFMIDAYQFYEAKAMGQMLYYLLLPAYLLNRYRNLLNWHIH